MTARSYASEELMFVKTVVTAVATLFTPVIAAKSDQANEKGVLDQILAFFAVHQVLQLHIQLPEIGCSFSILSDL